MHCPRQSTRVLFAFNAQCRLARVLYRNFTRMTGSTTIVGDFVLDVPNASLKIKFSMIKPIYCVRLVGYMMFLLRLYSYLIDRCSIPYAIKQVQELQEISCAFEQAVQRFSTSVTMVAKGVLKEHLILLGNSMTCTGDLIGFNSGGFRSLYIQVPFTEATLFTPKRWSERAAEKRHVDSLQSTVAAFSWGKQVVVGRGSRFDVLRDTKMQVFLQMIHLLLEF